jgi:hypothetical protein
MALAGVGAVLLNIASQHGNPLWLVGAGLFLLLFPMATIFRRQLFGEQ